MINHGSRPDKVRREGLVYFQAQVSYDHIQKTEARLLFTPINYMENEYGASKHSSSQNSVHCDLFVTHPFANINLFVIH